MTPAATLATFADFRLIKGRKQAQLVFEVPIEKADEALAALGGLPRSDDERWCGIALVQPPVAESKEIADKPRRHFSEMPRSQQAGMLCADSSFQSWLSRTFPDWPFGDDEDLSEWAANIVRWKCSVDTRARLDVEIGGAGAIWDGMVRAYHTATGRMAEIR